MENIKKHFHRYILFLLIAVNALVWQAVFAGTNDDTLTVAFLDIGQGDAIYIEAPNGIQILLDGGPNKSVLAELGSVMPRYDTSLDIVIASHPDKDHIGGLPAVLERYTVGAVMEPGVDHTTEVYREFERIVEEKEITNILARRGMRVVIDKERGIFLDILLPDGDVKNWETNDASILARLSYGKESFMLTGDLPQGRERYAVSLDSAGLHSTVLKLGHHGSRTSSSLEFLNATAPEYAVVSAGKDNQYGHPHKEVIDRVSVLGIPILSTAEEGTIIFETDGRMLNLK